TAPMPDRDRPPLEERDFVRINNQFVVPVLDDGQVNALVVLSISLETRSGIRDVVFAREPKLRDALLQVLFDHANAGGFSGNFTSADQIAVLRRSMWEAARPILGADVFDVLITDIARQDN
ncbi:MAG: flagellar basal body-associated FliL family protein, partial [Pseudomonadota bacterium]